MYAEFSKNLKYLWNHPDLSEDQGEDRLPQREAVFPTKWPSLGTRWPESQLR